MHEIKIVGTIILVALIAPFLLALSGATFYYADRFNCFLKGGTMETRDIAFSTGGTMTLGPDCNQ